MVDLRVASSNQLKLTENFTQSRRSLAKMYRCLPVEGRCGELTGFPLTWELIDLTFIHCYEEFFLKEKL
jgi:hypothetical protein